MILFNLSQTNFKINNVSISFPIELETLKKLLSTSCRASKNEHNTIYTWDEFGIVAYSKSGQLVESLVLELTEEKFDFSYKQAFTGKFLFEQEDVLEYYKKNKDKTAKLFEGNKSGALILNGISVLFSTSKKSINAI